MSGGRHGKHDMPDVLALGLKSFKPLNSGDVSWLIISGRNVRCRPVCSDGPQTSARSYLCTKSKVTMMDVTEPSSIINLRVRRRACLSCTSAKVKCTSASLGAESCGRCERLGKGCVYAEPSSEPRTNRREAS